MAALLFLLPFVGAASPVEIELHIPPAETHVIGDPIPLFWRFSNRSPEPLAFLWEGCCRLNGRLNVWWLGADGGGPPTRLDPVPPGQALAHMFAKAERLEPERPRDFDTRLSDWVRLEWSGRYRFEGAYTGVLPSQQPQVPRGLGLWRDSAKTAAIEFDVLSAADYLAQREARSKRRGMELKLSVVTEPEPLTPSLSPSDGERGFKGRARGNSASSLRFAIERAPGSLDNRGNESFILPPLESVRFTLSFRNTSGTNQIIQWPHAVELWVVDAAGRRVESATRIEGDVESLTLAPGQVIRRPVRFHSDHLEGEPLGCYRVFVDLKAEAAAPRVPSNPISLEWQLGAPEVLRLLTQAAGGERTGLRNPYLKLLRVYLGNLRDELDGVPFEKLPPPAAALGRQLALAARLKPIAPVPGQVDLTLEIAPDGTARFADPTVREILSAGGEDTWENLGRLLEIRRHLGWQIALWLEPAPALTMEKLRQITVSLEPLKGELAGAPQARVAASGQQTAVAAAFQAATPADAVLRVTSRRDGRALYAWRAEPGREWETLLTLADLERQWPRGSLPTLVAVRAGPELKWEQVVPALELLARLGVPQLTVAVGVNDE